MPRGDISEAVGNLGGDPARWLVGLDFDGTLAPIVGLPEDARPDQLLVPILDRLRVHVGTVAVVSGRPRAFLQEHLPGVLAVGSYGLELPPELSPRGAPEGFDPAQTQADLLAAGQALEDRLPPGARLERKPFGIALHYRGAGPGFDEAAAGLLAARVATAHGLALTPGRLALELKPAFAVDKGWALGLLAAQVDASSVVFVGDDHGDVPAWEVTREMGARIASLAVGIASPELAPAVLAGCDVVLPDRAALAGFLSALAARAEALAGPKRP